MEKLLTNQSTQMKLLLMEPLFKLLFLLDKEMKKLKNFCFLMLHHFLLELKQLEESWQTSLTEIPQSQLKRIKSSQLIKITNQESRFKYLKEREKWQKITTCLVNSTWTEFHQLQEEFHKSKLLLTLMPTVSWMYLPSIKELVNKTKSPSPMIKVVCQRKISKRWSKMLRNSKLKMNLSRKRSKPRMDSKTIASKWETLSMMKSWRQSSLKMTRDWSKEKLIMESNGLNKTQMLMLMPLLESKKKLNKNTIQLWWEFINKLEDQELVVCQVDSQELVELEPKMLELKISTDDYLIHNRPHI